MKELRAAVFIKTRDNRNVFSRSMGSNMQYQINIYIFFTPQQGQLVVDGYLTTL